MKLPAGGWVPIVIKQGNIFEPVALSHNVPFHVSWHSVGGCYHNFSLIFFYLVRDKRNPEHLIDSKNQRPSLFYCSYFFPWFFFFFFDESTTCKICDIIIDVIDCGLAQ